MAIRRPALLATGICIATALAGCQEPPVTIRAEQEPSRHVSRNFDNPAIAIAHAFKALRRVNEDTETQRHKANSKAAGHRPSHHRSAAKQAGAMLGCPCNTADPLCCCL